MHREVPVELSALEDAFVHGGWELRHYLDLETGDVVAVADEVNRELEEIYGQLGEEGSELEQDVASAIGGRDVPPWEKEALLEAHRVEEGFGTRYLAIPWVEASDAYRDMEAFIPTVEERSLQERLWHAIGGRKPFRRFRDILGAHPAERERWFKFESAMVRERVLEWLEDEGIAPLVK
ncbi:MAG: UPF0158 family protein [Dehalococcoidia bacterium]